MTSYYTIEVPDYVPEAKESLEYLIDSYDLNYTKTVVR